MRPTNKKYNEAEPCLRCNTRNTLHKSGVCLDCRKAEKAKEQLEREEKLKRLKV